MIAQDQSSGWFQKRHQSRSNLLPPRYPGWVAGKNLGTNLLSDIDRRARAMLLFDQQCHGESFFVPRHLTMARRYPAAWAWASVQNISSALVWS